MKCPRQCFIFRMKDHSLILLHYIFLTILDNNATALVRIASSLTSVIFMANKW